MSPSHRSTGYVKNLTLAAMFLALALILPLVFTGQLRPLNAVWLPMHIPVLLCGLICGWQYGGMVGLVAPFLRFALFGMPRMPDPIFMTFELAAYGALAGLFYGLSRRRGLWALYRSLLLAMAGGRAVWAAVHVTLAGVTKVPFGWQVFLASGFTTALPGILLQLILIPLIMVALDRTGLVPFDGKTPASAER